MDTFNKGTVEEHDNSVLENTMAAMRRKLTVYSEYIGDHETRTRTIVVDEILEALGWDVTDPSQVWLEHPVNGNKIDYVLLGDEQRLLAVVEAKPSREGLNSRHRRQATGYAVELGVDCVVLTNGGRWESWRVVSGTPRRETMTVELNITTGDIRQLATQLAQLHPDRLGA